MEKKRRENERKREVVALESITTCAPVLSWSWPDLMYVCIWQWYIVREREPGNSPFPSSGILSFFGWLVVPGVQEKERKKEKLNRLRKVLLQTHMLMRALIMHLMMITLLPSLLLHCFVLIFSRFLSLQCLVFFSTKRIDFPLKELSVSSASRRLLRFRCGSCLCISISVSKTVRVMSLLFLKEICLSTCCLVVVIVIRIISKAVEREAE